MGRDGVEPVGLARERAGQLVLRAADHDDLEILELGAGRLGREGDARACVGEYVGVLLGGEQRIERHRHDAGADRAEEDHGEVDGVEQHQRDAVLAPDAAALEQVREPRALAPELIIGQPPLAVDERDLVGASGRDVAVEKVARGVVGLAHGMPDGRALAWTGIIVH